MKWATTITRRTPAAAMNGRFCSFLRPGGIDHRRSTKHEIVNSQLPTIKRERVRCCRGSLAGSSDEARSFGSATEETRCFARTDDD